MEKSGIEDTPEENQVLLGEFNLQENVTMYSQVPDYDDPRGSDLPNEKDLTAISKRIYGGFARPPWLTLKRRL